MRLLDGDVDVGPLGQTKDFPHHVVVVRLQPRRHRRRKVGGVLDDRLQTLAVQHGGDDLVGRTRYEGMFTLRPLTVK